MADNLLPYNDIKYLRFNESLDEDCRIDEGGQVKVGGTQFQPSNILYEMEPIGYAEAYQDFLNSEYERIKDVVYNQYPSCIAYNFRLSEKGEGASDPVRKLLHLKDTWESIVFVLYAIVWGEIRHKAINLKAAQILVGISPVGNVYKSFNTDRLISDAIKSKIQNLKAVIEHSISSGLNLKSEDVQLELLDKLLSLQDIRNDISHHTAPTREEAEAELLQVIPLFKEMLMMTEFLAECKILRFESFTNKCRCEEFNGHFLNKEFDDFNFEANEPFVLGLGQEQLFIKWENDLFSLSPFLHFLRDAAGRETYLSFFKKKEGGKYQFEPITKRSEVTFDHLQARFDSEQAVIINLIVP